MANMQPYQFIKTLKFLYTIIKNFRQIANNLPYKKIEISKVQQETVNRNHNETCSAPLLVNVKLGEYFCYLVEC